MYKNLIDSKPLLIRFNIISHNYALIKVDWYDSLPPEKNNDLSWCYNTFKSVFNKDKNNYYYIIFLEKGSHELPRK